MHVLAVVNQKGGVGKSPISWEVAAAMAARGRRVILGDFDPQGTGTAGVLGPDGQDFGTAEVLLGQRTLADSLQMTATDRLSILASHNANLSTAEQTLKSRGLDGFIALVTALEHQDDVADILVCDCPPNLSVLTGNVLNAASYVIVPVDSTQARVALSQLKRTIEASKRLNPDLRVLGAVLTRFVANQKFSADCMEAIAKDDFFPAEWPVRLTRGFEKAFRTGQPLRAIASSPAEKAAVAEVDAIAEALDVALGVPA